MAVSVAKKRKVRGRGSERVREALVGYGFVAAPMAFSSSSSSTRWSTPCTSAATTGASSARWTVRRLGQLPLALHDTLFWQHAMQNTLGLHGLSSRLQMALGLLLAVVVNNAIRFRTFFRAAFYFPSLASSAAITAIAIYMLASTDC